jgi:hypothetical protein
MPRNLRRRWGIWTLVAALCQLIGRAGWAVGAGSLRPHSSAGKQTAGALSSA